ncbi:glycosyl transferase group 1 [Stanieria cyanosphaera PCC 7437]|uniref:Glycosyl transferase group 1 n=1 Tax=Stanieria cyanosphaera (strain ATCC 29371 / PCC 7437) TaxID=111780 RepID=K9XWU4_STAC7|nr:glycosyltransferase family 4 protein [Stanieria cyanosphaera]AFZ36127.1 glycosyl transferase group 1 [Stanieria cyanosphaera PCC 7437]
MTQVINQWMNKIKSLFFQAQRIQNQTVNAHQSNFKVSIFTQFFPPDYAATGQLIQELATHLAQQGMDIKIFTGQPGYAFDQEQAPAIERFTRLLIKRSRITKLSSGRIIGKALSGVLFCLRSSLHLLKSWHRGDVLMLTTAPPFLPAIGYLANLCFKRNYVCLIYDLYPDITTALSIFPNHHLLVKIWTAINHRVWQRAQGIIVLSPTMKQRLVAQAPQLADKISVIHNWADPDWIKPIPKEENWFATQYGMKDKFTVLYSGNLGRCHDAETIIETIKLLQHEPIQFVFIGGGAKKAICIETVANLGLQNCIFLPYQHKTDLPYSLTACDLSLVSIAPGFEGLVVPSKLYGILAAGRPVAAICESHSYLRELLEVAGCGVAFSNNDSLALAEFIRFLALNPEKAMAMGKAGRTYLESHFTPEIIAQKYLQVLKGVIWSDDKDDYQVDWSKKAALNSLR